MRFLHTMLRVGDLQRSIDFYTKVLGMMLLRTTERPDQKYSLAFVGYATVETKGNMVRGIKPDSGVYRCEAKVLAQGRSIMTAEAQLTGPDGKLYAHGTSTLMVLRPA